MEKLYIYHHLGLGDHLICNGLVRYIVANANIKEYVLFSKSHNHTTVSSMFSDIPNLEVISMDSDSDVISFLGDKIGSVLQIGFHHLNLSKFKFDESFYNQFNLPFEYRWSMFRINRDKDKEMELFHKYDIQENNYIFLHDDPSRNYLINRDFIQNKELKVISPILGYTDNMIDYSYIMENAKELHFMDSSFRLLFDSLIDNKQISFYHTYVRGLGNENVSNSKKMYYIINNKQI